MGTANRKPPFGVPTNLSEQLIGNQFFVPTILVSTALFPQSLWEHHAVLHWFSIGTPSSLPTNTSCSDKLFPQICRNGILCFILPPLKLLGNFYDTIGILRYNWDFSTLNAKYIFLIKLDKYAEWKSFFKYIYSFMDPTSEQNYYQIEKKVGKSLVPKKWKYNLGLWDEPPTHIGTMSQIL